jgi:tol-pal system protein YbgF
MQEQMRKIQEDNEFRFEELEKKKKADAGSDASINTAAADSAAVGSADETGDKEPRRAAAADAGNDNVAQDNTDLQPAQDATADNSADSVATGQQTQITVASQAPRALGSIRFDASGNVIGGSLTEEPAQPVALPQTDNPNELYNAAYQYILAGDYRSAEAGFRAHIDRYPADPMTSDARYWLGEALYGQERYAESATVFIDMQRDYPDSKRGAENMLKLGMAMAKLNDREVACATFAKVGSRFPSAAPAILKRVDEERKLNHC